MKLSEGILKGCQGTEQYFGDWFAEKYIDGIGEWDYSKCCALGAAMLATNAGYLAELEYKLNINFEFLLKDPVSNTDKPLYKVIIELNDLWRWPREKIAEWLQEIGY